MNSLRRKKVLFLTIHRLNRSPSQRFRFEQYLDFLNSNGWSCKHSYLLNENDDYYFYRNGFLFRKLLITIKSLGKRIFELFRNREYDVVFVQREAFFLGTVFFEKKLAANSKLIFDFDDAIWIDNTSEANKMFSWLKNFNKIRDLVSIADCVFVGNQYLATFAREHNKKVKIIPTTIDTKACHSVVKSHTNEKKILVGWTGSHTSLRYVEGIENILLILKSNFPRVVFKIICNSRPNFEILEYEFSEWNLENEISNLFQLDIGLMPMPKEEWAKGKCGFKILQYNALGIPAVASPVGVNSEIIEHGKNGFLASTVEEWIDCISKLIESPELRNKMGKAGRKTVVEKYSVEANKGLYLKYLNELVETD